MSKNISAKIYKIISSKFKTQLYLHEPNLNKKLTIKTLEQCIKYNFISSNGPFNKKFENEIKKITKAKNCVSLVNGTSALYLSLYALGCKTNDEVLLPSFNFIAAANACLMLGLIPHFVEVEKNTFGIDPIKLEKYLKQITFKKGGKFYNKKTKRLIKFIIPTHVYGHICKIHDLIKIAKKYKLSLIEDASEALGSTYLKKHAGTFGDIGVLSFNGNKIVTTGGGGAIICKNKNLAKNIRHLSVTAKKKNTFRLTHDKQGFNLRMPHINAAIGYNQLLEIKKTLEKKRKLFEIYQALFQKNKNFTIFKEPKNTISNYWLQTLLFKNKNKNIELIIKYLCNRGIEVRPGWTSMTKINFLKKYPRMKCPIAENLEKLIINLPSGPQTFDEFKK